MYHALRSLEETTWGYRSRNWLSTIIPLRSVNRWKAFTVYSWRSRAAAAANLDWVVIMRQLPSEFFIHIHSFNFHNSQVDTVIVSILLKKTLWHREAWSLIYGPTNSYDEDAFPHPPHPRHPGESWGSSELSGSSCDSTVKGNSHTSQSKCVLWWGQRLLSWSL